MNYMQCVTVAQWCQQPADVSEIDPRQLTNQGLLKYFRRQYNR